MRKKKLPLGTLVKIKNTTLDGQISHFTGLVLGFPDEYHYQVYSKGKVSIVPSRKCTSISKFYRKMKNENI